MNEFHPRSATVFHLREEHLRLVKRLSFYWDEQEQRPQINAYRPFGNSDVYSDVAEIVGDPALSLTEEQDGEYTEEQICMIRLYLKQVVTALEIITQTGQIEPGLYTRVEIWTDWYKTTEEEIQWIGAEKERRYRAQVRRALIAALIREEEEDCP